MNEDLDRYLCYRNLLACEDHILENLMGPESSEEGKYLRGMLNEIRYLRDDVIPKEANKKYHCIVKHLSLAYEAASEVAKATQEVLDDVRAEALRSLLYSALEKCLGRKIVICERCGVKEDHGGIQEESTGDSTEAFDDGFTGRGVQGNSTDRIFGISSSEAGDPFGGEADGAEPSITGREAQGTF